MKIKLLHGPMHDWEMDWPDEHPLQDLLEVKMTEAPDAENSDTATYKRSHCPPNLSGGIQYYYFAKPGKSRHVLHAILDDELALIVGWLCERRGKGPASVITIASKAEALLWWLDPVQSCPGEFGIF